MTQYWRQGFTRAVTLAETKLDFDGDCEKDKDTDKPLSLSKLQWLSLLLSSSCNKDSADKDASHRFGSWWGIITFTF